MPEVPAARTALVTGASRGIGRELAVGLARAGLDVALLARDEQRLTQTAQAVTAAGARALVLAADVTDATAVEDATARAQAELGPVDLLVNNAGVTDAEVPLWEADPEEWWSVVETNVRGPFLLARSLVPGMLARGGGRVIDLSSGSGTRDFADATAYTLSKTALFRIGGALHEAGFERGLRAFELAPGVVRTDMTGSMRVHEGRAEWTDPPTSSPWPWPSRAGSWTRCPAATCVPGWTRRSRCVSWSPAAPAPTSGACGWSEPPVS